MQLPYEIPSNYLHPFVKPNTEKEEYGVFPVEFENRSDTFFHGTSAFIGYKILNEGFRFTGALPSISFADRSRYSLGYACGKRELSSPEGCILACVLDLSKIKNVYEGGILHVYEKLPITVVKKVCIIPQEYVWQ